MLAVGERGVGLAFVMVEGIGSGFVSVVVVVWVLVRCL